MMEKTYAQSDDRLLLHKLVFLDDVAGARAVLKSHPQLINERDAAGNTPLHLALLRQDNSQVIHLLLDSSALNPKINNRFRLNILESSVMRGERSVLTHAFLVNQAFEIKLWQDSLAAFAEMLSVRDFSMDIKWEVSSIVPFLGMLAPNDVVKFRKWGRNLRVDMSFNGMTQGLSIERASRSFLFIGDASLRTRFQQQFEIGGFRSSHAPVEYNASDFVFLVDHESKSIRNAAAELSVPDADEVDRRIAQLRASSSSSSSSSLSSQTLQRTSLVTTNITFGKAKSIFGYERNNETAGDWPHCSVYHLTGLKLVTEDVDVASIMRIGKTRANDFETYFSSAPSAIDTRHSNEDDEAIKNSVMSNDVTATLHMTDKFPLSLRHVTQILEVMKPVNANVAVISSFLSSLVSEQQNGKRLEGLFPVKFDFPVRPGFSLLVTFQNFQPHTSVDATAFQIPNDYLYHQ